MLEFIRKHSKSVFVKVLLSVLALTFLFFFGIMDIIRKVTGHDYVVKIANVKIAPEEFKLHKLKAQNMATTMGLDTKEITSTVLHQLIWENVLGIAAQDCGIRIADATLKQYIGGMDMFRNPDGTFNSALLRGFLSKVQMPESLFLESVQREIKTAIIKASLGHISTDSEVDYYIALQQEYRTVVFAELDPKLMTLETNPTDADLEDLYNEHDTPFMAEETRSFKILEIAESEISKDVVVTEEELRDAYEFSQEKEDRSFEDMKSELSAELTNEKVQSAVNAFTREVEDSLMSSSDIDNIVKKYNLKVITMTNVSKSETNHKDLSKLTYGQDAMEVAFGLEDCGDSSFSEAKNSDQKIVLWLVHVDKITPKHKQPFEKIRDKVVAEWKSIKLKEQAIKHATEMISKASANTTLRQVLTTEGYTPKESQPFNRLGEIKRADTKNDMIQAICDDVFAMNLGETRYKEHNGKIIVFQSVKIERSKTKDEKKINTWKRELHSAITNDLFQQLMGYMSSQYKISINYDVLKEIDEPVDTNLDLF